MKFKRLNESANLNRYVKNAKSCTSAFKYGVTDNLTFDTFAEDEGGNKALQEVEKYLGYVINGQCDLRFAIDSLFSYRKQANYNLERALVSKGDKAEYKQDYFRGYLKVLETVLCDLEI